MIFGHPIPILSLIARPEISTVPKYHLTEHALNFENTVDVLCVSHRVKGLMSDIFAGPIE